MAAQHRELVFLLSLVFLTACNADLVFTETPADSVVARGQPAIIHCSAYDSTGTGTVFISWRHNNTAINSGGRFVIYPNGTLELKSTQDEDEGSYSCTATIVNSGGTVTNTQTPSAASLQFAYIEDVFYNPTSMTVLDMQPQPAYFQCISGNSLPLATITWEKDGQPLSNGGSDYLIYSSQFSDQTSRKTSGTLQIDTIRASHAGEYRCVTTNPLLPDGPKTSATAILTVNANPGAPYISQAPMSQIIPVGQPATFACSIRGDPAPTVTWLVDGTDAVVANSTRVQVRYDGALHFPSVSAADEGSYYCKGTSRLGAVSTGAVTLTAASMEWSFVTAPSDLDVLQGHPATLSCRPPISRPAANVTWYRNNLLYTPRNGAIIRDEGDLYFSAAQKADEGVFFCVASNDYIPQQVTSPSATLTVAVPSSISTPPSGTDVILGNELSLTCQAEGDPTPTISWYKDGRLLTSNDRTTIGSSGLLHVRNIVAIDEGTYRCDASNPHNTATASAFVNVLIPPQITASPGDVVVGEGSGATIPCSVIGDPTPNVTWYMDGAPVAIDITDPTFVQTNEGLVITEARPEHAGRYECRAQSAIGTSMSSGTLTVWTIPVFTTHPQNQTAHENMVVTFECQATGVPNPTLSWRFNDGALPSWASVSNEGSRLNIPRALPESTGRYTCTAANAQGTSTTNALLDVLVEPSVQALPNVTIPANQPLTVLCQADGYPSPSFTWLRGQNILMTSGRVTVMDSGLLTISGLSNADQGWYSCVASNDVGNARDSFYLFVIDLPGAPTILEAYPVSATSVYLVWVGGGEVDDTAYFQIQYSSSGQISTTDNLEATPGNQTYTLPGLQENKEYHISVLAKNVIGSTPSPTVIVTTPSVTGPSPPRNFAVTTFDATSISLVWEIPAERNSDIDTYLIEYFKSTNNEYGSMHVPGSGQATITATVPGLRPVTSYLIRVCGATLHNGERQWGNCTDFLEQTTLTAAPDGAPVNVSAATVSATSITTSWGPIPEIYENGPIMGYRVQYRQAGTTSDFSSEEATMSSSHLLRALAPWTTYEVRVLGYNDDGAGPASSSVAAKTLAAAPSGTPQEVELSTINQTAFSVSWQTVAESERRGPIDGYTVIYAQQGTTMTTEIDADTTEFTIDVLGLLIAQVYEVQVLAYNIMDGLKLNGPRTEIKSVPTADGIPGPISGLTAVQGPDFIMLQWSPPLITNGRILAYVISYTAMPANEVDPTSEAMPLINTTDQSATTSNGEVTDLPERRRREAEVQTGNETHGTVETSDTSYTLNNLRHETDFRIEVKARTSAGLATEVVSISVTTGTKPPTEAPSTAKTTQIMMRSTPPPALANSSFFNLFNLPKTSLILFLSIIGLGVLSIIMAIAVLSVWCSGRRHGSHRVKRKTTLLLPNDGRASPGTSIPSDDFGLDNHSRSASSVYKSHSPTSSSELGTSSGLAPTPSTMPMMDSQPLIHDISDDHDDALMEANRPRASSSPASAQLSVRALPKLNLPATASVNLYPTAPNPRNGRLNAHHSADLLDTSPAGLEALYSRVNRTNLQGASRLKKDSLAAIAVLLDQEENETDIRPLDSPPSVVIANQRTTL